MRIERVDYSPRKEVYHPGEVVNVAIRFAEPFVGQCEIGFVPQDRPVDEDFRRSNCARSSDRLYEGQLYLRDGQIGQCALLVRLAPVKGSPQTVRAGEQTFEVRPLRP
jgi:hypothetical protein